MYHGIRPGVYLNGRLGTYSEKYFGTAVVNHYPHDIWVEWGGGP